MIADRMHFDPTRFCDDAGPSTPLSCCGYLVKYSLGNNNLIEEHTQHIKLPKGR